MTDKLFEVIDNYFTNAWCISMDGFFKKNAEIQMLKDEIPQYAIDTIYSNAARILSKCPNPNVDNELSETGIVIGKVQSGKTSNFISVLGLAFDNGYDIAVVLGGNNLPLLNQNATRINSAFNVESEKLTILKTNDNKSLINENQIKEFVENGRKIIIVGLKHHKHINRISEIFNSPFLADKSVLIIDDEGDQATLNTKAYLKSMSSTYESVLNLKAKLKSHCFLSITATPQANILIRVLDELAPDFGELVYPGDGYCGLSEFHGNNQDKYIYEIPQADGNLLDNVGVPDSVYKAMSMFFVGNSIRHSRGDPGDHAMLIHPSQKKFDHEIVRGKIQGVLEGWKSKAKIKLSGRNDISYESLKKHLVLAYNDFKKDGVKMVAFEELEKTILNIINQCSPVHMCNSNENASDNSLLYKTNIFVGGNLVERGITIKGLAVTYITRRAKGKSNVDNMEQRARWFGYKQDYLDICRVFATKDIKDDFSAILEHEEDMWDLIERTRDSGISFKEMPRVFKLNRSAFLNLTRRNVAKAENYSFREWKPQKYIVFDKNIISHNEKVLYYFKKNCNLNPEVEIYNEIQKHAFYKNFEFDNIYSNVLSKLLYKNKEVVNKSFFSNLNEALNKLGLHPKVDLVWVRYDAITERKINSDETIQQLFQGRNPNELSEKYYGGDRSLSNKQPDNIQIQIHSIRPSNMPEIDFCSPVLAVYIPNNLADKLSGLVVNADG